VRRHRGAAAGGAPELGEPPRAETSRHPDFHRQVDEHLAVDEVARPGLPLALLVNQARQGLGVRQEGARQKGELPKVQRGRAGDFLQGAKLVVDKNQSGRGLGGVFGAAGVGEEGEVPGKVARGRAQEELHGDHSGDDLVFEGVHHRGSHREREEVLRTLF